VTYISSNTRGPKFVLRESLLVQAPIERLFALSTNIAIVQKELGFTPVAGRTSGCVRGGDTVRWEGWKFGFPQLHVSLIADYEPPFYFQDRMLEGRFKTFEHDHRFREVDGGVLLEDELRYSMPFGLAGQFVGQVIMVPHILRLMRERFAMLKGMAEGDEWRAYPCD
jgi:ligand-binding SRPBCC domain-containing protein